MPTRYLVIHYYLNLLFFMDKKVSKYSKIYENFITQSVLDP